MSDVVPDQHALRRRRVERLLEMVEHQVSEPIVVDEFVLVLRSMLVICPSELMAKLATLAAGWARRTSGICAKCNTTVPETFLFGGSLCPSCAVTELSLMNDAAAEFEEPDDGE